MDNATETPAPFITPAQLGDFVHKAVVVAGKVTAVTDAALTLDAGGGATVSVSRSQPSQTRVEMGMNLLVRGFVSPDKTVTESKTFPPTDMGDNFNPDLFNKVAKVTSATTNAHMFQG